MSYDNTNRGAIWKNERKETDSHPDFTGSIDIEGTEYWVSGWKRKPDAKPTAPALSLSVKLKENMPPRRGQSSQSRQEPLPPQPGGFEDSDIPF